jgi:hypothetical protein
VIIDSEYPADSNYSSNSFYFIDTSSGSIYNSWNGYIAGPDLFYGDKIVQKENLLFLGTQNSIDVINLEDGTTKWQANVQDGRPSIFIGGDLLFKASHNDNWGNIWSYKIQSGQSRLVYNHSKEQGYKPVFVGIEYAVAPNGDELIVWKNWSLKGMTQHRTEFFCYNLTHDSLMWRSEQYLTTSSVYKPIASDSIVIGLLLNEIVAFDIMTGQTLWKLDLTEVSACPGQMNFSSAGVHINEDHIIMVYTGCPEVTVLDLNSGIVIKRWPYLTESDYSKIEGKFTHYNGKLFFISQAELQVIDDYTGQPLFDPKRLNHLGGRLWNGVAIDSATQSMYIHNGQKLFCLRIPPDLR